MSLEQEIEAQRVIDKRKVETANALRRLIQRTDFRTVILDGYLKELALTLVYERNDSTKAEQALKGLDAISHFKTYLDSILDDADIAEKSLEESSETLDEIRQEAIND